MILAGGPGTRLFPLTKITNKHLLPVYDRPMIYYPIQTLVNAGIDDIMIVTGGRKSGDFLSLLGNGRDFGLKHLNYTYQEGEGGIAEALGLAEHWAAGEPIAVILGDNLIENNIAKAVADFKAQGRREDPSRRSTTPSASASRPGRRQGREDRREAEGARVQPRGHRDLHVRRPRLRHHQDLEPSERGELEITDVNNWYIQDGSMTCEILEGWWTDAGKSLHHASS